MGPHLATNNQRQKDPVSTTDDPGNQGSNKKIGDQSIMVWDQWKGRQE